MDRGEIRILVAEDDELNRELLGEILNSNGYGFTAAENGKKALEAYSADHYGVVLLDLGLPVIDGASAAKGIREISAGRGMGSKLIALSGDFPNRPAEIAELFDHVLQKPYTPKQLLALLDGVDVAAAHAENGNDVVYGTGQVAAVLEKVGGDRRFLKELLDRFISSSEIDLNEMENLILSQNEERLLFVSHKLKGGFAIFNNDRAANLINTVESEVKKGRFDEGRLLLPELQKQVAFIRSAFWGHISEDGREELYD